MVFMIQNYFQKAVRNEWSIENKLHWHLDYTLKEDYSTIIDKRVAFNLNIIRKSVLLMLKIIDVGKKYSLKNKIHYINGVCKIICVNGLSMIQEAINICFFFVI